MIKREYISLTELSPRCLGHYPERRNSSRDLNLPHHPTFAHLTKSFNSQPIEVRGLSIFGIWKSIHKFEFIAVRDDLDDVVVGERGRGRYAFQSVSRRKRS